MHLANQSSEKPDKLSQVSSKLDKLSQSSMGDTLDKREATDLRSKKKKKKKGDASRRILRSNPVKSREAEQRGTLGQGTTQTVDYPCCRKLWSRHKA